MNRTKVLVVDDSFFIRKTLTRLIECDDIEVVGTASNGQEAIELAEKLRPDLITMDIEMPVMNGLDALRHIMETRPVPVLMVSTMTTEGADLTLEALSLGAIDFIAKKPAFNELHSIKDEIKSKIREISGNVNLRRQLDRRLRIIEMKRRISDDTQTGNIIQKSADYPHGAGGGSFSPASRIIKKPKGGRVKVICIGVSTGGPVALQDILPFFPENLPVPVLIVQHMPPHFTKSLADRLNISCKLTVKEAENGDKVMPGTIYIAPGGKQMQIRHNLELIINDDFPAELFKPSVNVMINSVIDVFGKDVLAVIMTGMGSDGSAALKRLHDSGGFVISQDYDSCVVSGMPRSAVEAGAVDEIINLHDIPDYISSIFNKK